MNVYLSAMGMVNALGATNKEVARGLFAGDSSGMVTESNWVPEQAVRVGRVRGPLPGIPESLSMYRCRNNQLLLAALSQIDAAVDDLLHRYGSSRIGVILGTSTSGIAEGEAAIAAFLKQGGLPAGYDYRQQEIGGPSSFLARHLGIRGPAYTVSTACTSSAKTFASARRLLQLGFCDAVLVGGVDSLCKLTLNGFSSLESISSSLCNPMSRNRCGINIGEAAALFIMTREEAPFALLGVGETSDAHHISAPDPNGTGAENAMRAALLDANVAAAEIDYLNLHATATPKNDEVESHTVARVFPDGVATSGTKPLTGHCLGAAGATELAFCLLALEHGRLPPHRWDGEADPALPVLRLVDGEMRFTPDKRRVCMSNSFAFGGNNISLVIGDPR